MMIMCLRYLQSTQHESLTFNLRQLPRGQKIEYRNDIQGFSDAVNSKIFSESLNGYVPKPNSLSNVRWSRNPLEMPERSKSP